jgi:hypothetical protein
VVPANSVPTGNTTTITTNPYLIQNLQGNTVYDLYISATCASSNASAQVGPVRFTTQADYCGNATLVDSGGLNGNYSNEEFVVQTIYPNLATERVRVSFDLVSLEDDFDFLFVLDGPDVSSPVAAEITGTGSFPDIASNHPSGALTIAFFSDAFVTAPGYQLSFVCEPKPDCSTFTAPFLEEFPLGNRPACWQDSGTENFLFSTEAAYSASAAGDISASGNTTYAWVDASQPNGPSATGILETPFVDISNLSTAGTSFFVFSSNPTTQSYNLLNVEAKDENDNTVTLLNLRRETVSGSWEKFTFDLAASLPGAQSVQLIFTIVQDGQNEPYRNDILIDDVQIDEFSTLGISSPEDLGFLLYPNPAGDVINAFAKADLQEYTIYDMQGRIVQSETIKSGNSVEIYVNGLSGGSYLIQFKFEGQVINKQFIKK